MVRTETPDGPSRQVVPPDHPRTDHLHEPGRAHDSERADRETSRSGQEDTECAVVLVRKSSQVHTSISDDDSWTVLDTSSEEYEPVACDTTEPESRTELAH